MHPGGLWSFTFASEKYCPLRDHDPQRIAAAGLEFSYYNAGIHRAAFCLPEHARRELGPHLTPFEDAR